MLQLHQLGHSLLFCKTIKHDFLTAYLEWLRTHAHVTGTLLRIYVLLHLEHLLETTKLLNTNHLIPDIAHQWLNKKYNLVHQL